jgi:hypothetical protein
MSRTTVVPGALLALLAVMAPGPARAQQAAAPAGFQVQEFESGFVVAPDVRVTNINDRSATLAGVYGGYQLDRTLLVGGAAYWLTNRDDNFDVHYAGGLARWTFGGHRAVGISTGAFIGVGEATLSRTYGDLFGAPPTTAPLAAFGPRGGRTSLTAARTLSSDTALRVRDDFVVAEPQVNVLWRLTPWLRVDAGAGYRFIGASDLLHEQLRGASGSLAIQLGGR